jgi:hypothetical protein
VFNNYQRNGLTASDFYSGLSSPQTYLVRAGQGAIIAATGGAASALFAENLLAQSATVGVMSGVVGAGGNAVLGEQVTPQSVFWDTSLGALSFGLAELTPGIRGALPKFGTNAFYFGAHTQANAAALGVDAGFGFLGSVLTQLTTPQARSTFTSSYNNAVSGNAKSGGGSPPGGGSVPSSNSLWVTPSGAVVTWGGSLVVGPVANSTPKTK